MSDPAVHYVGPFQSTRVVIDGRQVPFLEAQLLRGGRIERARGSRCGGKGKLTHYPSVVTQAIAT